MTEELYTTQGEKIGVRLPNGGLSVRIINAASNTLSDCDPDGNYKNVATDLFGRKISINTKAGAKMKIQHQVRDGLQVENTYQWHLDGRKRNK